MDASAASSASTPSTPVKTSPPAETDLDDFTRYLRKAGEEMETSPNALQEKTRRLRQQRADMGKEKRKLTQEIKNGARRVKRIRKKSRDFSREDMLAVLYMRQQAERKGTPPPKGKNTPQSEDNSEHPNEDAKDSDALDH